MGSERVEKEKLFIHVDREIVSKLRHEKADTRQTLSAIIEDVLRARYANGKAPARRPARAGA